MTRPSRRRAQVWFSPAAMAATDPVTRDTNAPDASATRMVGRVAGNTTQNTVTRMLAAITAKREYFRCVDTWAPLSAIGWGHHHAQTERVDNRASADTFLEANVGDIEMMLPHRCSHPVHTSTWRAMRLRHSGDN